MNNIRDKMEDKTHPTCANDEGNKNQSVGDTIDSIDTAIPHAANNKGFPKEFELPDYRYFPRQQRPATSSPLKTTPPKPLLLDHQQLLDGKISGSVSEQNFGQRNMGQSLSKDVQHEKFESPEPMSVIMRNSSAKQSSTSRSSSTPTTVATTATNDGSSTSTSSVFDHHVNLLMKSAKSTQSLVLPPIAYDHLDQNGPPFLSDNGYLFNVCHESFFSQSELLKYFPDKKLRVSVITWNMNSRPPTDYDRSLRELFHLKPFQPDQFNQEHLPEMFVLGLQEAPFSVEIIDTMKIGIQSVLGPNYALLQWSNVGVLHCSIWLRRELLWSCTTVQMIPIHSRHIAANRIRTKGAIALSFGLFGTLFLFINTHLNAHENKLQARMNQLEKMERILNLNLDYDDIDFDRAKQKTSSDNNQQFASRKHRHRQQYNQLADNLKCQDRDWDVVFWFGDLNFRLELPIDLVLDTIRKINRVDKPENRERYLKKLIDSDQLTNLMQRGMVFKNFQEAQWPPSFLPTYKCRTNILPYRPETEEDYEISASDLKQIDNVRNSNSESFSSGSILSSSTATTTTGGQSKIVSDSVDDKTIAEAATTTARQSQLEQDEQFFKTYDIRSGRVPSFTDRILFSKCKTGGTGPGMVDSGRFSPAQDQQTKCLYYNSVTNLKCSDHKPVYALFEVTLDSVGPRNPSTIKRLSRIVDDVSGLMQTKNDADEAKQNYPSTTISDNKPASDSEYVATEEKKGKSARQKLRKMIQRNFLAFRKPNRISISSINPAGLGLLPKGFSRSSKVLDSQSLVSKNNNNPNQIVSDSSVCLGRLGQFNAGAYDRETYLKGMQLRNRSSNYSAMDPMYQSLSMEEIKKLSKKPKHHASFYRHQIPLVKSASLESDMNQSSANMPKHDQPGPLSPEPVKTSQNHEQSQQPLMTKNDQADPEPETYENIAHKQPANKNDPEPATNQASKFARKASFKRNQNRVDNASFCIIL